MSEIFLYFWLESSVGVVKTEIYVPVIFFFTKQKILIKYILSQSFSVFRRKFSRFESRNFPQVYQFCIQFVWRNISRESIAGNKLFFIAFFKIFTLFTFLWIYADFSWQCSQNWNLRFHRVVFMGSLFIEKKISNCISICRPKFFGFMAKRFLHSCQNCIFCVQWNIPWRKFFLKNLVSLHEEVRWNFLEIRSKNSQRVVRTALYMPGE